MRVMFVDDNEEFIRFVDARLRYVYDFHSYNNIINAEADVETTMPDLVICKQEMTPFTGSELCNKIKSNPKLDRIKFVLMTDGKLNSQAMQDMNITMAADEYLSKPFNLQEAAMRFNKLMGINAVEITNDLIEGAETRMLEGHNSSMTTATETINYGDFKAIDTDDPNDEMHSVDIQFINQKEDDMMDDEYGEYNMKDSMDHQLIKNIEQYVQQNMSRGQINLEEMAQAMGMGMRPLFLKVRDITGKTPAEVVRDMRLKNACILLKRTNINMSELATNVGFATGESFINIFKDKFGILPSEYRLKYRK
jgi:AraC-like DNA-binding protein/DNA-binding response OmpR family regulator